MTIDVPSLRVLELGGHPGVALCGRMLAGLGMTVARTGQPRYEEVGGQVPLHRGADGSAISLTGAYLDQGKRLLGEEAVAGFRPDVVLTDQRADLDGAARGAGLVVGLLTYTDRELREVLHGRRGGVEIEALALSGLLHLVGDADREPLRLGGLQAGYAGGLALFSGVMVALTSTRLGEGPAVVRTSSEQALAYVDWKSQIHHEAEGVALSRGADTGPPVLPCADGHVGFYYRREEWAGVKALFDDPRLEDPAFATQRDRDANRDALLAIMVEHTRHMTSEELYRRAQDHGVPAGAVRTLPALMDDEQYRARGFMASTRVPGVGEGCVPGLPWTVDGRRAVVDGVREATPGGGVEVPSRPLLDGLRVLDLSGITAGGRTTQLLADHGAVVVKVEAASRPDPFRSWSGVTGTSGLGDLDSPPFRVANRNKRGVAIDLKTAEGHRLLGELVARSDIVVENFRRGVMQRLGLGMDQLRAWNPEVVLMSITSQGEDGPESRNKSFGGTLEALGGLMAVTGYEDGPPVWSTSKVNYPDQVVALAAPGLALWAVEEARRTGRGLHLELAQRELVTALLGGEVLHASLTGRGPARSGNRSATSVDVVRPCAGEDEWVVLSLSGAQEHHALASVVGLDGLADDPGAAGEGRLPAALEHALTTWCAARSRDAAAKELSAAGLVAAPVRRAAEVAEDGRWHLPVPVPGRGAAELQMTWPFTIDGLAPPTVRTPAPHLGQHTREVLAELGHDDAAIDAWVAAGVVATNP